MIVKFSERKLRSMPRPPEYMDELRAIAKIDGNMWRFDDTDPRYIAVAEKYRPKKDFDCWLEQRRGVVAPAAVEGRSKKVGRGLGDTVAKVLDVTGIGPVAKKVIEKMTGKPCGCGKRQEALNKLVPYAATEVTENTPGPQAGSD